jgi:hypothetical protein
MDLVDNSTSVISIPESIKKIQDPQFKNVKTKIIVSRGSLGWNVVLSNVKSDTDTVIRNVTVSSLSNAELSRKILKFKFR